MPISIEIIVPTEGGEVNMDGSLTIKVGPLRELIESGQKRITFEVPTLADIPEEPSPAAELPQELKGFSRSQLEALSMTLADIAKQYSLSTRLVHSLSNMAYHDLRGINVFEREHIYLWWILAYRTSEARLLEQKAFGQKTLREFKELLEKLGLAIGPLPEAVMEFLAPLTKPLPRRED